MVPGSYGLPGGGLCIRAREEVYGQGIIVPVNLSVDSPFRGHGKLFGSTKNSARCCAIYPALATSRHTSYGQLMARTELKGKVNIIN